MKQLFVFFIISMMTTITHAQTGGDWCAELKRIALLAAEDESKVKGKEKSANDEMTTYETPVMFPGANSMVAVYYTGGRLSQVKGYYARGNSEAEVDKAFKDLVAKLKACFPGAEELEYPHEVGYKEAWSYSDEEDEEYYSFWVGKSKIYNEGADPSYSVAVIIEF